MLESDFNGILTKSLNESGWFGFKIGDQRSSLTQFHSKNPYDLFGYYKGKFVCCESKWLKKPSAFNFTRLEDHQIENLIKAYEMLDDCLSIFAIGVDYGRGDKRVFVWKNSDLYHIKERKELKNNIHKKEFDILKNYVKIKKGLVNFDEILELPPFKENK